MATKSPEEKWTVFSEDDYAAAAKPLVHQSFKTVNSNAAGGGIRIGADKALCLPYVAARTLIGKSALELDSFAGGAAALPKVKQLNWARQGHEICPPSERQQLLDLFTEHTRQGGEFNADKLDPRLRQVLIPAPNQPGGYVVLTPITPAGVCKAVLDTAAGLNEAVKEFNKTRLPNIEAKRLLNFAQLGLGGSRSQNVGLLVRSMQRPLFFQAPTLDRAFRAALATFHLGPILRLPRLRLEAYRSARLRWRESKSISTGLQEREGERAMVLGIARLAVEGLRTQSQHMTRVLAFAAREDDTPMFSDSVDIGLQILSGSPTKDPSERRDAARYLARKMNERELTDKATLGLDQGGLDELASWIEEDLL